MPAINTKKSNPKHPGLILKKYLKQHELTKYRLAQILLIPETRIGDIVLGKRAISVDTALRLAAYFSDETTALNWLELQAKHNIDVLRLKLKRELNEIKNTK